jgi:hypothetical protein
LLFLVIADVAVLSVDVKVKAVRLPHGGRVLILVEQLVEFRVGLSRLCLATERHHGVAALQVEQQSLVVDVDAGLAPLAADSQQDPERLALLGHGLHGDV